MCTMCSCGVRQPRPLTRVVCLKGTPMPGRSETYGGAPRIQRASKDVMQSLQSFSGEAAAALATPEARSPPGTPAPQIEALDLIPSSRFVLNARFLGRFFMRNAKKANTVVAVYPDRDRAVSRHNMYSSAANNSQIARPHKTSSFKLVEMLLLEPEAVLERLLKNVLVEESLRLANADKVRRPSGDV